MGRTSPTRADVVGLIPAAGHARRLGRLPSSKELLPVGVTEDGQPRPVCDALLRALASAEIPRALVLLRKGKWDIPAYLGEGSAAGPRLAFLAIDPTPDVATTLDRARPFVAGARVALGFPDMLFSPHDLFDRLLTRQEQCDADIVLGAVPSDQAWKADMVDFDPESGRVRRIAVKEADCGLEWAWICAVWTARFTTFLADEVASDSPMTGERHIGVVIRTALESGFDVRVVACADGQFLDIGTPDDYRRALTTYLDG
ncbi:MAG: dTDP-glucose pyrophosphorylase [Acidobacteriota bacterium]